MTDPDRTALPPPRDEGAADHLPSLVLPDLAELGPKGVWSLSTQGGAWQGEAARRLSLPVALLSDHALALADAINLARFGGGGETYLGGLTMIVESGTVRAVRYPLFPPEADPGWVRGALASQPRPR